MNSGNTGLDNGLTAQASKQGENFVVSPKPVDSQGFSFDTNPPSEIASPSINQLAKKPNSSVTTMSSVTDTTPELGSIAATSNKKKRKPIADESSVSASKLNSNLLEDPFFAYMLQHFLRQQQQQLMNLFSSSFMDAPNNQFGSSALQMPSMDELQNSMNTDNMELIEDRVLEDSNGKGHLKTFKSKDGSAVVQTITYNLDGDGVQGLQNLLSGSSTGQSTEQASTLSPTSLFSRPNFSRIPASTNLLSMPRRMWVH